MSVPYWRLSGFYFFYFATLGSFLPFWSLYLAARGFDALAIGELSALMVGTKIVAPNIWGWIADYTGKSLRLIRIACFFASVFFAGFLAVQGFMQFALLTLVFSFFWNASLPQFEAATLSHLHAEPQRYAQIRLWGSVGFIAGVLGVGRIVDQFGIMLLPGVILALSLGNWLVALLIPDAKVITAKTRAGGFARVIWRVEVLAFLGMSLLVQVAHSVYYVFFSVYLQQFHYSASVTGLLWAQAVAAEILLFLLMRRVLAYCSLRKILLWSLALSALRWYLTAAYPEVLWIIIGAQLLHVASFGALHVVAMYLVQRYFGVEHQGKGQALYTSVSFGAGGMLGGYASGYFWTALGAQQVFLLAALCCVLAWLIALIWVGREKHTNATALG